MEAAALVVFSSMKRLYKENRLYNIQIYTYTTQMYTCNMVVQSLSVAHTAVHVAACLGC